MHKTTLEQWALLEKVVELGSFARAAEETNRSQSSVSYNLALLQERLGVALLAPSGRRAVLTPAGELLLNQVKPLLQAFAYVETHAATLRNGARTRLDLVVDSIFPRQRLFAILRQFQQRYPQTQVRLTEVLENLDDESAARTEADVMVLTRRQDITGRGEWLMNIDFIAVAHRDHPLAALDGPLEDSALDGPLEDSALAPWPLVRIADQGGDSQAPRDAWTFSTIDAAIDAVMYQVGFGWLPEERIRPHLDQGVLKRLPLSHGARRATPLHLIVKRDLAPIDEQVATLLALFRTP
ncbi:TPA: LysR family transcriptional regulator [Klebsiella pneumoniae]